MKSTCRYLFKVKRIWHICHNEWTLHGLKSMTPGYTVGHSTDRHGYVYLFKSSLLLRDISLILIIQEPFTKLKENTLCSWPSVDLYLYICIYTACTTLYPTLSYFVHQ